MHLVLRPRPSPNALFSSSASASAPPSPLSPPPFVGVLPAEEDSFPGFSLSRTHRPKAIVLMPRMSYTTTETVLSNKITRNRIVLPFNNNPKNSLGRRPHISVFPSEGVPVAAGETERIFEHFQSGSYVVFLCISWFHHFRTSFLQLQCTK